MENNIKVDVYRDWQYNLGKIVVNGQTIIQFDEKNKNRFNIYRESGELIGSYRINLFETMEEWYYAHENEDEEELK